MHFAYVDADQNPELPGRYNVMGLPTLILFKNGKPQDPLVGFQPESNIRTYLQ
ncbi:thioredoxin family protein [Fodinisporobacter ferrooxydans]|uniref:Thioredoxin family protein n=1 Tax=Fodinisporobacter ferrooxydans TaxID=2901836 RepID=A0ABY4CR68_9BACL|nr:thioredoxin family protein [Alicyclobacillaceae bacterium MYW30-H2]